VAANTSGARTGTIAVAGQTFTVTQAAAIVSCTYGVSPTSASIAAAGGSGSTAVSAGTGCAWTASSNAGWLTITSGTNGSGNGSVAYSVAANTGGSRSANISVAGQTFTVTQAAAPPPCTYSIDPTSVSIGKGPKASTVKVSAGSGCAWTARSNAGWITVTSGGSGSGNGTVAYSVTDNPDRQGDRTGTLTIAGQTFTVNQKD